MSDSIIDVFRLKGMIIRILVLIICGLIWVFSGEFLFLTVFFGMALYLIFSKIVLGDDYIKICSIFKRIVIKYNDISSLCIRAIDPQQ